MAAIVQHNGQTDSQDMTRQDVEVQYRVPLNRPERFRMCPIESKHFIVGAGHVFSCSVDGKLFSIGSADQLCTAVMLWSERRTRVIPSSSSTLATSWICTGETLIQHFASASLAKGNWFASFQLKC